MARVARSYPCGFPGCNYVAETRKFFQAHIVKEHGALIEKRRKAMVKKMKWRV